MGALQYPIEVRAGLGKQKVLCNVPECTINWMGWIVSNRKLNPNFTSHNKAVSYRNKYAKWLTS